MQDAAQMFAIKTSTGLHFNTEFYRNKKFMGEQIAHPFKKGCNGFLPGVNKHLDSRKFCLCLGILLVKHFLDLKKKRHLCKNVNGI